MNYECINCNLELDLREKDKDYFYTCPNCGNSMLGTKYIDKIKSKLKDHLEKKKEEIDEETLKELIGKEEEIKNQLKNASIQKYNQFKNDINTLFKLLKDPKAHLLNKAIAGVALAYVLSPLDLIPDFIPVVGYVDDFIMIALALTMLKNAITQYETNNKTDNKLFYNLFPQNANIPYEYEEKDGIRILNIKPNKLEKYQLNIINNGMPKAPEIFLGHPYFCKTLVPLDNYDNYLIEDILKEEINLLAAFGAKRINISLEDFIHKSGKAFGNSKTYNDIAEGKLDAKKEDIVYESYERNYEFDDTNNYDIEIIDDLTWYFSSENIFNNIIQNRIKRGVRKEELKYEKNTKNFLDFDARTTIENMLSGKLNLDLSKVINRKIDLEVEFHPQPKEIDPMELWSEVRKKIDNRKEEITKRYNNINYNKDNPDYFTD